jgi:Ca2+-binding RTX toxin-like protein
LNPTQTIVLDPANALLANLNDPDSTAIWLAAGTPGTERIVIPEGFAFTQAHVRRGGDDVIIGASSGDSIAAEYALSDPENSIVIPNPLSELTRPDWLVSMPMNIREIYAGGGDDQIKTGFDQYTVDGGDGNDLIITRAGNDVFIWRRGR